MPMLRPVGKKRALLHWVAVLLAPLAARLRPRRHPRNSAGLRQASRILWLNIWGLGDLALTTPALASLREAFPDAEITILIQPATRPLLAKSPYVDKIISVKLPWANRTGKYRPSRYLRGEFWALVRSLRGMHFDLAIDAHADIRNNVFLWLIGARRRLGLDLGGSRFLLTDLVKADPSRPHHADVAEQLVAGLGGKSVLDRPSVVVAAGDRTEAESFWEKNQLGDGKMVVGIHAGAGSPTRYWGLDKFAAVADSLASQYPVKLLCFAQPDGYGSEIPIAAPHFTVAPRLGLLMALLEKCDLLLCNDGGPMHIATAVGTPVVAVFGPTEPNWWGPKGPGHELVILDGFPCRPCGDICKFDQPYCLTRLPVETVLAAAQRLVERLLAGGRPAPKRGASGRIESFTNP